MRFFQGHQASNLKNPRLQVRLHILSFQVCTSTTLLISFKTFWLAVLFYNSGRAFIYSLYVVCTAHNWIRGLDVDFYTNRMHGNENYTCQYFSKLAFFCGLSFFKCIPITLHVAVMAHLKPIFWSWRGTLETSLVISTFSWDHLLHSNRPL
jgi:hypothetical protein